MFSGIDYSMRENASILANRIIEYWKKKGYEVKVGIEPFMQSVYKYDRRVNFTIKSDLINGLPPGLKKWVKD